MKKDIKVIILPLYFSNAKYNLFEYNKEEKTILDIFKLDSLLNELSINFNISQIDIIGGEISLLSDFYFDMLYNLIKTYNKKINVFTNFIETKKSIINNCNSLNVIHNFNEYSEESYKVFSNIKAAIKVNKIINLKSLDISCKNNQTKIIQILNDLKIKSFEIIPNHFYNSIDYNLFEMVLKQFLKRVNTMKFAFQNKLQLENILPIDNYNIQKIYITPEGKYGIQYFKDNKPKLFLIDNILKLNEKLTELEIFSNNSCKKCTSKLMCMANYFLNLNYTGESCSGFKNIIDEYKKGII